MLVDLDSKAQRMTRMLETQFGLGRGSLSERLLCINERQILPEGELWKALSLVPQLCAAKELAINPDTMRCVQVLVVLGISEDILKRSLPQSHNVLLDRQIGRDAKNAHLIEQLPFDPGYLFYATFGADFIRQFSEFSRVAELAADSEVVHAMCGIGTEALWHAQKYPERMIHYVDACAFNVRDLLDEYLSMSPRPRNFHPHLTDMRRSNGGINVGAGTCSAVFLLNCALSSKLPGETHDILQETFRALKSGGCVVFDTAGVMDSDIKRSLRELDGIRYEPDISVPEYPFVVHRVTKL